MYWDANNFYGWGMPQHLTYGKFEWDNQENINTEEKILELQPNAPEG